MKQPLLFRLLAASAITLLGASPAFADYNAITNSTFDTNSDGWAVNAWDGVDIDTSIESGRLCININDIPDDAEGPWSLNIRYPASGSIAFEAGADYTLTADIYADDGIDGPVSVNFMVQDASYANVLPAVSSVIDDAPTSGTSPHTIGFTSPASVTAAAKLDFQFGLGLASDGAKVCFDNIELWVPGEPPVVDRGPPVQVNQVGYLPLAAKVATVATINSNNLSWELLDANDLTAPAIASGNTTYDGIDAALTTPGVDASEQEHHVHHIDFSHIEQTGSYVVRVEGVGDSSAFDITDNLYPTLATDAMAYFYFHRMGSPIKDEFVGNEAWAHAGLHAGDEAIPCWDNWCDQASLNVRYSWADAGDFGIYPVNHAISAWTLLNLYETQNGSVFGDGSLNIPTTTDGGLPSSLVTSGVPDILDEVLFGSTYLAGMLPTDTSKLASHKVHNEEWSWFPEVTAFDVAHENSWNRNALPGTTPATLAVARVYAHLARTLQDHDPARASQLWAVAKDAYGRVTPRDPNSEVRYYGGSGATAQDIVPTAKSPGQRDNGGGNYDDGRIDDDYFAAHVEMYLTAKKLGDSALASYRDSVAQAYTQTPLGNDGEHPLFERNFDWANVGATGILSLYANDALDAALGTSVGADIRLRLEHRANEIASAVASGYPTPYEGQGGEYIWGSTAIAMNQMIVLGSVYKKTDDVNHLKTMYRAMDYLMGNNAMRMSYVTGYGEKHETDTHDRIAWGAYLGGEDYPKGWVTGGPNNQPSCVVDEAADTATPAQAAPAKSYAPANTAPDAFCSKENTINWNSPLVWVSSFLQENRAPLTTCEPNCLDARDGALDLGTSTSGTFDLVTHNGDPAGASYQLVGTQTAHGEVSIQNGIVTYTSSDTTFTSDSFLYRIIVGTESAEAIVTVTRQQVPNSTVSCSYLVHTPGSQWNENWQAAITIENNTDEPIEGWDLALKYPPGTYATNAWDGRLATLGEGHYRLESYNWSASIPAGTSRVVEIQGHTDSRGNPGVPELSGSTCANNDGVDQSVKITNLYDGGTVYPYQDHRAIGLVPFRYINGSGQDVDLAIDGVSGALPCCHSHGVWIENWGLSAGDTTTWTLATARGLPEETDSVTFTISDAAASCEITDIRDWVGDGWQADVQVTNTGTMPGKHWSVGVYFEDKTVNWRIGSWNARVRTTHGTSGLGDPMITYQLYAPSAPGTIEGGGSYTFTMQGSGDLPQGDNDPSVQCAFGDEEAYRSYKP